MNNELTLGQHVRLDSEGPEMEVCSLNAETALCEWTEEPGQFRQGIYPISRLRPQEPEPAVEEAPADPVASLRADLSTFDTMEKILVLPGDERSRAWALVKKAKALAELMELQIRQTWKAPARWD